MATTTIVSAAQKNNGGTVYNGGSNAAGVMTRNLTPKDLALIDGKYGGASVNAVSTASSGNIGTRVAVVGGRFSYQQKADEWLVRVVGSKINGTASTLLGFTGRPAGSTPRSILYNNTYRRYDNSSWNYVTGALTKGGSAGALVTLAADHAALPTNAVPGELTYLYTGTTPTQDDYKARTNP